MKGRDGAYALDFVDMSASLDEPLPEKREAWPVAKQKEALWPREPDLLASDIGAGLALGLAHPGAWRVKARKRGAVCLIRGDPDGGEHALCKNPGLTANRLPSGGIFERRPVCKEHYRCIFRAMRKDPLRA